MNLHPNTLCKTNLGFPIIKSPFRWGFPSHFLMTEPRCDQTRWRNAQLHVPPNIRRRGSWTRDRTREWLLRAQHEATLCCASRFRMPCWGRDGYWLRLVSVLLTLGSSLWFVDVGSVCLICSICLGSYLLVVDLCILTFAHIKLWWEQWILNLNLCTVMD